ncbi:hypothetical protein A2164_00850 [Candidatus Curtissbacteria bacterium RBG_13_35_7]|uniref:Polysaccharide chain length determinant N-terminal domain-containing protein n=1 Tax=Candidatus Curtissbacteria bacterium RBG_13_35_7 TaxID=1797705 RepID=A0A1F5G0Z5_9BACT|nr:MAG: hypothetical protein A2164_00850 [Candidatus Curtissbacteria bacterium RBG_13_35_7]
MDLKEFIKIIKNNLIFIALLVLIGAFSAVFSAKLISSGYRHTQTFFLQDPQNQDQSIPNIRSESYFQQEKSRNFTDTAIAILESADFKKDVLGEGGSLTVRKMAPQVIRLTYTNPLPDSNNSQLSAVVAHFNTKIQSLTESTPSAQLKSISTPASPVYSSINSQILFVFGALLGGAFALFIISLKNYFKL